MVVTLGRDVLWYIFSVNADMEDESKDFPAIKTLRHTSQVCSAWRDLALASHSLWGRVLNFDFLHRQEWRDEVMRRTGSSPLFVQGGIGHRKLKVLERVVTYLLAENWARIRSLKIKFLRLEPKDFESDSDLWSLLERPATALVSFQLSLEIAGGHEEEEGPSIFSPPNFKMFNSHAPSLKVFVTPNMTFNIRAPWTSHIRHLALTTPILVQELFEALCNMPLLETLEDKTGFGITHGDADWLRSTPKVALPRLMDIRIYTPLDITPYMAFLRQIEPANGRVLAFSSRPCSPEYDPNTEAIAVASEVLSTFSGHAELANSTKLNLSLTRNIFTFEATLPDRRSFFFSQYCYDDLPLNATTKLFTSLNFDNFHHVLKLTLWFQEAEGILPSDPNIATFIISCTSIETLETTTETLGFLLRFSDAILEVAFPVLQEIVLRYPRRQIVERIQPFLSFRRTIGRPISALSILAPRRQLDLTSLEEFTGLTVTILFLRNGEEHKLREYTCGSGRSEELLLERESYP